MFKNLKKHPFYDNIDIHKLSTIHDFLTTPTQIIWNLHPKRAFNSRFLTQMMRGTDGFNAKVWTMITQIRQKKTKKLAKSKPNE